MPADSCWVAKLEPFQVTKTCKSCLSRNIVNV